jgi:CelD/BcsL family acetyltransferase involved in cellulose biosynthesis
MSNTAFRANAADIMGLESRPSVFRDFLPAGMEAASGALLQLELIRSRAAFDALEPEWDALFARAAKSHQAFQRFGWLWHWCNHFGGEGRSAPSLAIVTGRVSGRLVMVWPLVVERVAGLKQLAWMGDPVSQYGDVLAEPQFASTAYLRQAYEHAVSASGADLVLLRKVRSDAVVAPLLAEINAPVVATEEAPFIDWSGMAGPKAFEDSLPAKSKRNRRRLMRRLEERGAVSIEELQPGESCSSATSIALAHKRSWLQRKKEYSRAFNDRRLDTFFAAVASGKGPDAGVSASVLRCGGEATSVNVALRCKGRELLHIIVYNSKFEKSGAGVLHMEATLRRAAEQGTAIYDFLAPRHDYKLAWASGSIAVNDHAIACNGAGWLVSDVYWKTIRPLLKRVVAAVADRRRPKVAVETAPPRTEASTED